MRKCALASSTPCGCFLVLCWHQSYNYNLQKLGLVRAVSCH
jgi:hypothetical protein